LPHTSFGHTLTSSHLTASTLSPSRISEQRSVSKPGTSKISSIPKEYSHYSLHGRFFLNLLYWRHDIILYSNRMTLDTELFQQLLDTERERLEDELGRIGTSTGVKGSYDTVRDETGTNFEDNATETDEFVSNDAVRQTLEDALNKVYEALAKIESGTYGSCEVCHEPIATERLKVYPAATTCIKHA